MRNEQSEADFESDLLDTQRLELALLKQNLSDFLNAVTHDLHSPSSTAKSLLNILTEEYSDTLDEEP